jgi:hypothetical protein
MHKLGLRDCSCALFQGASSGPPNAAIMHHAAAHRERKNATESNWRLILRKRKAIFSPICSKADRIFFSFEEDCRQLA